MFADGCPVAASDLWPPASSPEVFAEIDKK